MITIKKSLLTAICLTFAVVSHAYDFIVDGVAYNILSLSNKAVYVCGITSGGEIIIPDSVSYNSYVFSVDSLGSLFDCTRTTSITFSKKINTKGSVLYGCGTAYFNVHSSNPYMTTVDGILYSKDMSRLICYPPSKTASEFLIPESVTTIDDYSFGANRFIRRLIFNDNIEELPENFLYGTDYSGGVTYLKLSNKIKVIYGRCLESMSSIKEIILPKELVEVEKDMYWPYYGLPTSLTDITIYNSRIANYNYTLEPSLYVFSRFSSLANLHVLDSIPVAIKDGLFTVGKYFTMNLYVPKGCKSIYQETDGWKNFYNIKEEDDVNVAVESIQSNSNIKVAAIYGKISIQNNGTRAPITIYNTVGSTVYSDVVGSCETTIELPTNNVYIIKVGTQIFKVAL